MKQQDKIANIIPAAKLPKDLNQIFSYEIPEQIAKEIEIGSVVEIPFRRRKLQGVVFSFSPKTETAFKLKPIEKIIYKEKLNIQTVRMAEFVSEYYFVPLSWILKIILPQIPKRAARKKIKLADFVNHKITDKEIIEKNCKKIKENKKTVLFHNLDIQRLEIYKCLMKSDRKNGQTLLLMPEYFDIYSLSDFFVKEFGENKVAIINSGTTENQFFEEWRKIQSGLAQIIISTRQGVFMPFSKLTQIIVDEEHSSSYKQWDQNPRYNGRDVAINLAETWDASIVLSSPTPSPDSFLKTEKDFSLVSAFAQKKTKPQILDMEVERKNGNYNILSEKLRDSLLENIYNKKQAIIFIPRLGDYTSFQCKDCGFTAVCEDCGNTLIGHKDKLYCSRCKKNYELLVECPKCQGQNISSFGCGSSRIRKEIENLFEGKNIKIQEMNSKTLENISDQQKIFRDFSDKKIDLMIGTQMILKNWNMPNLTLIGIIFPEIIFSQNNFRSKEKIWQTMFRFYNLPEEKRVIIQTYKPENPFFEKMKNNEYEQFMKEELTDRRDSIMKIPYPPFGKIIKLIYKHIDAKMCEKEARYQYEILRQEIRKQNLQDEMEIISPFPAQNYREFGKYRWHIILRHKKNLTLGKRNQILAKTKKDWIIDIDPDEIT